MFRIYNFYVDVALQVLNLRELIFLMDDNFRYYWRLMVQIPRIYNYFEDHVPDVHDFRPEVWWERNEDMVNEVVERRTRRMTRSGNVYNPY